MGKLQHLGRHGCANVYLPMASAVQPPPVAQRAALRASSWELKNTATRGFDTTGALMDDARWPMESRSAVFVSAVVSLIRRISAWDKLVRPAEVWHSTGGLLRWVQPQSPSAAPDADLTMQDSRLRGLRSKRVHADAHPQQCCRVFAD
ncbi:hypothetical protein PSPO01_07554 [Paraphaeosphaeria sporulosa]